MSEVLQANVFFIITSVAVVVFTIFLCIALYYFIRILRNVRDMTDRLKRGTEMLAEDASAIHSFVHNGIIGAARNFFAGSSKKKSSTTRTEDEEVDDDEG